jgi:hypothetical protein
MENILKQIRLSTSQRFRNLLYRFYRAQDDFTRSNRISEFQRTNWLYIGSGSGSTGILHYVQTLYILGLNPRGFTA